MAAPPSPSDPQDIAGGRYLPVWSMFQQISKEYANNDQIDDICRTMGSKLITIKEQARYVVATGDHQSSEKVELHLRILWLLFYNAARFCSAKHKDRLVVELMLIHGIGTLPETRESDNADPKERNPLTTSKGVLWSDMPFLVEDMAHHWTKDCAAMSRTQRRNLHSFLATVGGVGVQDKLCSVGIVVLRDTFETPRERGDDGIEDLEDEGRTMDSLTVADLFDAAKCWMVIAWDRFDRLAEQGFRDIPDGLGQLGPLAKQAGVPDNGGFSVERLSFWRSRYRECSGPDTPLRP